MNVWLVGGTAKIPTSVEDAIKGDGYTVTRVSGSDRYETAAKIAAKGMEISGKKPAKAIVASGVSMADALAVSPVAFAKGYPVILTEKTSTPEVSKKALGNIGTDTKILVGGTAVVSDSVAKDLTVTKRVSGADRAVTANLVADWAKSDEGFKKDSAILVGGKEGFGADSLVASSFGGKNMLNLHFSGWDATNTYFKDHSAELTGKGFVIGGKGAVAVADVDKAQSAAQSAPSNQAIAVTPTDLAVLTVADEAGSKATSDDRVYTAKGLKADEKYRVTLVAAANVTVKDGVVTFKKSSTTPIVADRGSVAADITVVNGVPTRSDSSTAVPTVGAIVPANGVIEFRVDGDAYEKLIPVIYVDGGKNTALELDDKGAPIETFGLAGQINYLPVEADTGAVSADALIDAVDKSSKTIIAGSTAKVYKYDSNDSFYIEKSGGTADTADPNERVTLAQFEAELSKGDSISAGTVYQQNSEFGSTWLLDDTAPGTPTLTATGGQGKVDLDITPVTPALADLAATDSVKVFRAPITALGSDNAIGGSGGAADTYGTFAQVATLSPADDDTTSTTSVLDYSDSVAAGNYAYKVQTVVGGETSSESTVAGAASTADTTAPTVSSVTANEINNGSGETSELIVTFSEPVTSVDATKFTVAPSTQASLEIKGASVSKLNESGSRWKLTLSSKLQDASTDVTYNVTATAKAFKDAAGNESAAITSGTTFAY